MIGWIERALIFCVGGAVGSAVTAVVLKQQMDKKVADIEDEYSNEMADLREHYSSKEDKKETKDGKVESVGEGIPVEKKVDTHKTQYNDIHKKRKGGYTLTEDQKELVRDVTEKQAPSEHDDEPDIFEITEEEDELMNEPGYGQKGSCWDWMEMTYYTKDGGLCISSWGSLEDAERGRTPEARDRDESFYVSDILRFIKENEFDVSPIDIMYIRNNANAYDVKVTKCYKETPVEC